MFARTIGLSLIALQSGMSFAACPVSFDPTQVKVEWTAYKTTKKVGVTSQFLKATVSGQKEGGSVAAVLA